MSAVAFIILAAGESSRLGYAKQLKKLDGKTLLEWVIEAGLESDVSQTIVVLGSQYELISKTIMSYKICIARNENWRHGMSTSIVAGLNTLEQVPINCKAAIIATCDQPFLNSQIINSLILKFEETKSVIVASRYGDVTGVPALFSCSLFPELRLLTGNEGARKLIAGYGNEIEAIDFREGVYDIDTEDDWQELLQLRQRGK